MFIMNRKSLNILKDCTSNRFNFPDAGYLKKKNTINNSYRWVCCGSYTQTDAFFICPYRSAGTCKNGLINTTILVLVQSVLLHSIKIVNVTMI